jgi:glycine oxidase
MPARVSPIQLAVVGGGVIGAACARAAAQRGLKVALFAPGPDPAAASAASAGMLAAQIEPTDTTLLPLAVRGRDLYDGLAALLKDSTGIDIGFQRCGILRAAYEDAEMATLRDRAAQQRQAGLRCDWLDTAELHERWPGIAPGAWGALFAPEDGYLDPGRLATALHADAARLGVTVHSDKVGRVIITSGRVTSVVVVRSRIPAEHVVIAAGAWSSRISGLPRPIPVEPVRGQLVATAWPAGVPAAVVYHGGRYLLPRGNEAILGSTMERVGFNARTTKAGVSQIRRATARLCPSLSALPAHRTWAGLRPVTPDARPIIGADPDVDGLWYATGHGRNGILLAAITGEILGDLLAAGRTDVDISQLGVQRFTAGTVDG